MIVLVVGENREYLCHPGEEIGTDLGIISVPEDVKMGEIIETHLGKKFTVMEPRVTDLFRHLERTGAPILPRDVGLIIGMAGIGSNDIVLDAGTGTGILSIYLGKIGAKVITYEKNPKFFEVAQNNIKRSGVEEMVEIRGKDVVEDLTVLNGFSVVTLDMRNAEVVVEHARKILRIGGILVVYSPFIESAKKVVECARNVGLSDIKTIDTIQREMEFGARGSRPQTRGVGHSGYLTFARRYT